MAVKETKARVRLLAMKKTGAFRPDYERHNWHGWEGVVTMTSYSTDGPWPFLKVRREDNPDNMLEGLHGEIVHIGQCKVKILERLPNDTME